MLQWIDLCRMDLAKSTQMRSRQYLIKSLRTNKFLTNSGKT